MTFLVNVIILKMKRIKREDPLMTMSEIVDTIEYKYKSIYDTLFKRSWCSIVSNVDISNILAANGLQDIRYVQHCMFIISMIHAEMKSESRNANTWNT